MVDYEEVDAALEKYGHVIFQVDGPDDHIVNYTYGLSDAIGFEACMTDIEITLFAGYIQNLIKQAKNPEDDIEVDQIELNGEKRELCIKTICPHHFMENFAIHGKTRIVPVPMFGHKAIYWSDSSGRYPWDDNYSKDEKQFVFQDLH